MIFFVCTIRASMGKSTQNQFFYFKDFLKLTTSTKPATTKKQAFPMHMGWLGATWVVFGYENDKKNAVAGCLTHLSMGK